MKIREEYFYLVNFKYGIPKNNMTRLNKNMGVDVSINVNESLVSKK